MKTYNKETAQRIHTLERKLDLQEKDLIKRIHSLEKKLALHGREAVNAIHIVERKAEVELKDVAKHVNILERKLTIQEKDAVKRIHALEQKLGVQAEDAAKQIRTLERGLRSKLDLHRLGTVQDVQILQNKIQCISFVWPIANYRNKLGLARKILRDDIKSNPCFTSNFGYKVRLSSNLDDDNHLTVFLEIMKGKFDAILTWPFFYKYRLTLLNPGDHSKNITYPVDPKKMPDNLKDSFTKPTDYHNSPCGFQFLSNDALIDDGFVVDDTVYIKCEIDATSWEGTPCIVPAAQM